MTGKKYVTKDDLEAFARKLLRRIVGTSIAAGSSPGVAGSGSETFRELSDTPSSYSGEALKTVRVNVGESGLEFHDLELGDLADVDLLSSAHIPADGEVLTFDAASGMWIPATFGAALDLDDLGDVNTPAPNDEDVLSWDSGTSKWVPVAPSGAASAGMGTLLNEPFDALNTAALHGQGSYTHFGAWAATLIGTSTINVVAHPVSGKMLQIDGDTVTEGTSYAEIVTTFVPGLGWGTRLRWKMRTSNKSVGNKGVYIGTSPAAGACQVFFRSTGKISFYNGSTVTDLMNSADNTWYQIDVFMFNGSTAPYALVFVDGVQQGAPKLCGSLSSKYDRIGVYTTTTSTASNTNCDIDDLEVGSMLYWGLVD